MRCLILQHIAIIVRTPLLTFSLLVREDFWLFLDFPSGHSIFSTFSVGIIPGWHGMENGQKPETEKKESHMEKSPQLDRGKNGPKNGFSREFFPSFLHFRANFLPFLPLSSWGVFSIWLSISGFWPFSMQCQPGMIPNLAEGIKTLRLLRQERKTPPILIN